MSFKKTRYPSLQDWRDEESLPTSHQAIASAVGALPKEFKAALVQPLIHELQVECQNEPRKGSFAMHNLRDEAGWSGRYGLKSEAYQERRL